TSPSFANSMPALGIPATAPSRLLVTGADAGQPAVVRVFDYNTGSERFRIDAYPGFMGGVRVATGDVNGDGFEDVITAAGPCAGPPGTVFAGRSGMLVASFRAYSRGYLGGVSVAAGDVDGDGRAEIATASGAGVSPHVKLFVGATGQELSSFYAYDRAYLGSF